ncbi:hypothetical protein AAMO2058_000303300 [Amorphochlora amoebiformis]
MCFFFMTGHSYMDYLMCHIGTRLEKKDLLSVDLWIYERTNIGMLKIVQGCCCPCILGGQTLSTALGDNCCLACLGYTFFFPCMGPYNRNRLRKAYGLDLMWRTDDCLFPTFKMTCLNCLRSISCPR